MKAKCDLLFVGTKVSLYTTGLLTVQNFHLNFTEYRLSIKNRNFKPKNHQSSLSQLSSAKPLSLFFWADFESSNPKSINFSPSSFFLARLDLLLAPTLKNQLPNMNHFYFLLLLKLRRRSNWIDLGAINKSLTIVKKSITVHHEHS